MLKKILFAVGLLGTALPWLIVLAILAALAGCQPPQSHVTADGRSCQPVGYPWAPIWVTPDGRWTC